MKRLLLEFETVLEPTSPQGAMDIRACSPAGPARPARKPAGMDKRGYVYTCILWFRPGQGN